MLESNAEAMGGPTHCLLGRKRDSQSSTTRALIGRFPRRRHRVRRMQPRTVRGCHSRADGMVEPLERIMRLAVHLDKIEIATAHCRRHFPQLRRFRVEGQMGDLPSLLAAVAHAA